MATCLPSIAPRQWWYCHLSLLWFAMTIQSSGVVVVWMTSSWYASTMAAHTPLLLANKWCCMHLWTHTADFLSYPLLPYIGVWWPPLILGQVPCGNWCLANDWCHPLYHLLKHCRFTLETRLDPQPPVLPSNVWIFQMQVFSKAMVYTTTLSASSVWWLADADAGLYHFADHPTAITAGQVVVCKLDPWWLNWEWRNMSGNIVICHIIIQFHFFPPKIWIFVEVLY